MDCWSQWSQNGNHLMGLCDHTGPHLAPAKVYSHILHEVPKSNQKTVGCGGPLQREKGTSISFYFPHVWNKTKWERKHKSIQLSHNMTAWLTSATWQGYLHPIKAGDWCATDTALSLPTVTAFESRPFLHHTIHWKVLPKLTPWRGCHYKKWLIPWHQQHLVNVSVTASPSSCSSSVEPFVKVNISWYGQFITSCHMLFIVSSFGTMANIRWTPQKFSKVFKVTYWHLHFSTWLVSQLNPKGSMKELKVKEILVWSWNSRYWRIKSGRDDHQHWFHNNHACSVA